ncbi:unnamed protein product [Heterobilharzia americana]|nr:unnamed protein product [Heterobilharzia americana]CAH8576984.1 unnamed protein product [Heterobilharzia americana]
MHCYIWNPLFSNLRRLSSCRSFNLVCHFEPDTPKGVGCNHRNNRLPKPYASMMQHIFLRSGPSQLGRRKLNTILLSRRESKMSESVRMATPEGRAIIFKRLIERRRYLWPHAW